MQSIALRCSDDIIIWKFYLKNDSEMHMQDVWSTCKFCDE